MTNYLSGEDVEVITERQQARKALRLALPVMRRTVAEYVQEHMRWGDPRFVSPERWVAIRPDLEAIVAAEACIGRVTEAERLREAMRPFAEAADGFDYHKGGKVKKGVPDHFGILSTLTVGHLRRARAALRQDEGEG